MSMFPGQGSVVGDVFSHGAQKVSVHTLTVVTDHLSIQLLKKSKQFVSQVSFSAPPQVAFSIFVGSR